MKILFAYDGSESADEAIATAGSLLADRDSDSDAAVLTVWEPLVVEALHAARFGGRFSVPTDVSEIDEQSERQARQLAEQGARLAREHGFNAQARSAADDRNVHDTIVAEADELDVDLVVVGARGLSGLRAFMGSVSNHVLQHARRPVLVIPHTRAAVADATLDHAATGNAS